MSDFQANCREIDSICYSDLRSQLEQSDRLLDNSAAIPLTQAQENFIEEVCKRAYTFPRAYEYLNDTYCSLLALAFFLRNSKREQILRELEKEEWALRHEILTRWGWMQCQRELIERGVNLSLPYRCLVARRGAEGRNQDREFYYLLLFLHGLRIHTAQELLFETKRETPDFALRDAADALIGAEMMEAPQSDLWSNELDAQSRFFEVIGRPLKLHKCLITIVDPDSWARLEKHRDEIGAWLGAELQRSLEPRLLHHMASGFATKLEAVGNYGIITMGSDGLGDDHIKRLRVQFVESLYERIKTKIWRRSRDGSATTRKMPGIRPCHLVIYPNSEMSMRNSVDDVVSDLQALVDFDTSSHFDKLWIVNESLIAEVA